MNILDENIIASQRQLLQSWRIRVRQIGYDVAQKGISDEQIIPFLLQRRRPTFFTRDLGFFERRLCHQRYSLVCLAIEKQEAATFIRRVLCREELDTQAKRMGAVIRASHQGLRIWRLNADEEQSLDWR
ncbi:MAG: hypothetical protein ETSY1_28855 [Candidatus Entotheonella factor]|uniref:DUF5615 domain-containing protein n=1 Tax=Entotheonella factor TaxID=1429438 RepID=W4LDV8_ENTF1|nr:hypothetical protein [Candidatus Entotheonella palauensis]ETW95875.1 MAG: hypothetical protein ETSY1_28855 [Candidatus Entotheonella factor]